MQRKDGQHPIIFMNLGKIRYSVSAKKQALKRTFEHRVLVCRTEFNILDDREHNIQDLFKIVYKDVDRNKLIVSDVIKMVALKKQILILSERIVSGNSHSGILWGDMMLFLMVRQKGFPPPTDPIFYYF